VKRGDTLAQIGRTYGIPWNTIAKHNGLGTPSIYTGKCCLYLRPLRLPQLYLRPAQLQGHPHQLPLPKRH